MPATPRVLISRTDAIGDVVLTLPLATIIRQHFPDAYIGFLGKSYTQSVISCCSAVDEFVELAGFLKDDELQHWDTIIHVFPRKDIARKAKWAGIRDRIGTTSRLYNLPTCNKLVRLSRKNSALHEAQLNTKLLAPIGIQDEWTTGELGNLYSFERILPLPRELQEQLNPSKRRIILHPKSQGSAREWGLQHFAELVRLLPQEHFQIFISGTENDGKLIQPLLLAVGKNVTDVTGMMDLATFISFINACDCLVAASTGPLHIAAALGKVAVGLYPSIRPMHAGRWGPLGPKAIAFALPEDCTKCRKTPEICTCIRSISALEVAQHISRTLP
jgi:ADP-heptose:LPS heptosyltransferase